MLRQSPLPPKRTIEKCIIACPSSLVRNWANELDKWLGKGTISPLAVDGKGGRQELERDIRSWCEATGRNVARPGNSAPLSYLF
jgi:DNA repair and recombination protein RAD54 and RAD54-like protein